MKNNEEQSKQKKFGPTDILDLIKDIPVINAEPTDIPRYKTTMRLYKNGVDKRLYIYFSGEWSYVALT
jgi:hypothetical protein